jgi:large subunit ribosomal protein L40
MKQWANYRMQENLKDFETLDRMLTAQTKALNELRMESEELYQQAIQPDMGMIPFVAKGPVNTPPNKDYAFVDGEYMNTTKVYDGENKQD